MAGSNNMIVGFSGVTLLGYTLLLIGIHMFIPHPSATKKVLTLSYVSLILFALAQSSIVGTYFMPHLSGLCICHGLWSASCIFYICGLYTLKFIYIERISILNQHPMLASDKITKWIKYLKVSLCCSCIACVIMMITLTGGECHVDLNKYGCKPSFHVADIYIAIVMIFCDAVLFAGFCHKWWALIKVFKLSSNSKILVEMIQSFSIQFILTLCAMASCVIDGVVNLWSPDYSTLIVFCFDAAVVASCNFAMIKESQAFMWKYLCWPCKIPSFLLRGTAEHEERSLKGDGKKDLKTKRKNGNKPVPSQTTGTMMQSKTDGAVSMNTNSIEIEENEDENDRETPEPQINDDGQIVYNGNNLEKRGSDDHSDGLNGLQAPEKNIIDNEKSIPSLIIPSLNKTDTNNSQQNMNRNEHIVNVDTPVNC